jgi:hypothetical protein
MKLDTVGIILIIVALMASVITAAFLGAASISGPPAPKYEIMDYVKVQKGFYKNCMGNLIGRTEKGEYMAQALCPGMAKPIMVLLRSGEMRVLGPPKGERE